MDPRDFVAATVVGGIVAAILLAGAALTGCGGPPREVRHALAAAAIAVDVTDRAMAERYADAALRALEVSQSLLDYHRVMAPWDDLETALRAASASIQAVDLALDSWEAGGQQRWLSLLMCSGASLARVARALEVVGVEAPPEIESALALVRQIGEPLCVQRQAEVSQ